MADEKKISGLTNKTTISADDEFVFVDKDGTGADASASGQTSKIKFSDLQTAVGTQGPAGADGATGPAGPAGADGATGPAGADGATGPAGADGATGPAGADGAAGPAGPAGANGQDGATGPIGPVPSHEWSGDKIKFATSYAPSGQPNYGALSPSLTGPQGPQGNSITGPAGPEGPPGPAGPAGPLGGDSPVFTSTVKSVGGAGQAGFTIKTSSANGGFSFARADNVSAAKGMQLSSIGTDDQLLTLGCAPMGHENVAGPYAIAISKTNNVTFNNPVHHERQSYSWYEHPAPSAHNENQFVADDGSYVHAENGHGSYAQIGAVNYNASGGGAGVYGFCATDADDLVGGIGVRATGSRTQEYGDGLNSSVERIEPSNLLAVGVACQYQKGPNRVFIGAQYLLTDETRSQLKNNQVVTGITGASKVGTLGGLYMTAATSSVTRSVSYQSAWTGWSANLGNAGERWEQLFQNAASISTSDRNQKEDIEELSDAEKKVAVKLKGLIRKYRMKDAVAEKGDDARIHVGIIAQDVEEAFSSEDLDASRYGVFCKDTVYDIHVDGQPTGGSQESGDVVCPIDGETEPPENATLHPRDVYSVRYEELLAFIISAL